MACGCAKGGACGCGSTQAVHLAMGAGNGTEVRIADSSSAPRVARSGAISIRLGPAAGTAPDRTPGTRSDDRSKLALPTERSAPRVRKRSGVLGLNGRANRSAADLEAIGLRSGEIRTAGAPPRSNDRFVCGVGGKPDGMLRPTATVQPRVPRRVEASREILVPGLCIPVPKDGNLASVRWSAYNPAHPSRGEVLWLPDDEGTLRVPHPSELERRKGEVIRAPASNPGSALFEYRTVSFHVPYSFLWQYAANKARLYNRYISASDPETESYGLVSSVADVLDTVWGDLQTRKVLRETFHNLEPPVRTPLTRPGGECVG